MLWGCARNRWASLASWQRVSPASGCAPRSSSTDQTGTTRLGVGATVPVHGLHSVLHRGSTRGASASSLHPVRHCECLVVLPPVPVRRGPGRGRGLRTLKTRAGEGFGEFRVNLWSEAWASADQRPQWRDLHVNTSSAQGPIACVRRSEPGYQALRMLMHWALGPVTCLPL